MKLIKSCPKCKGVNEANADRCLVCGTNLIMIPPTSAPEQNTNDAPRYLICPVCGEKNYLKEGQTAGDIKFCKECEQDDIRNLTVDDIRSEIAENTQSEDVTSATSIVEQVASEEPKKATFILDEIRGQIHISLTNGTYVIGKAGDVEAEFFKTSRYVSRTHSYLRITDSTVEVKDVSTNGTYLNDKRIVQGEWVEIHNGDLIRFADASFEASIC